MTKKNNLLSYQYNRNMSNYHKEQSLGSGGFSVVDLCSVKADTSFAEKGALVAVKRIEDVENVVKAKHEAEILIKLTHRFIVKYLDNFQDSCGRFCIVLEYCDVGTIKDWLRGQEPVGEGSIWRAIWQLSSALTFLHGQNPPILHNDLKPSNILCKTASSSGHIDMKIADFGLSDILGSTPSATYYTTPNPSGFTWTYASPEVLRNESHVTTSSDMWSLGAVIAFIANDMTHLFDSKEEIMDWTGQESPLDREFKYEELHTLVLSLLAPDKHLRPTAEEILQDCSDHPERYW